MIKKKKILAVILARGGSKSILKKNIVQINHHPLISYSIVAAKNSKYIDKLIVSSDSNEIIKKSLEYGIDAYIKRPKHLASDRATSADALNHAVISAEKIFNSIFDYIIELPCVSPLRDHTDINFALNNADKEAAAYITLTELINANIKYLDSINNSLTEKVKQSFYGKKLSEFIADIKNTEK